MANVNDQGLTLDEIRSRVDSEWSGVLDLLKQKIANKAISAEGIAAPRMKKDAEFVADALKQAGIDDAHVEQATQEDGTPGAFEVVGTKIVDSSAPTVLLYAHHDVQPVPDASVWRTDPFVGTVVDGRMFGRGSSDDGAGCLTHIGSLSALGKDLGVNIKIFIEGEEEMGSPSFVPFLKAHPDYFDADVMFITDSSNWSPQIPSLTASLRGNVTMDVTVKVLNHPVHSGSFGGPILDANTTASMLVASLYDRKGNIVVPGLKSIEPVGGLQQDLDEADFRKDSGVLDGYTFAGEGSLASRLWTKPAIALIGMDVPSVDESFNQLAPECRFRLSMRVCPTQPGEEAAQAVADYLKAQAPFGAQVDVKINETGTGWAMDAQSVVTEIAEESFQEAFGHAVVNKGEGGSIPMIPILQSAYPKAKVLVDGPEDPMTNAHSPNESQDLEELKGDIVAEALMLAKFAARAAELKA